MCVLKGTERTTLIESSCHYFMYDRFTFGFRIFQVLLIYKHYESALYANIE